MKVDFGCGSGSLLDSLLDHATSLEKIVGVDISRKGLTRAAKVSFNVCFYELYLQRLWKSFQILVAYTNVMLKFEL